MTTDTLYQVDFANTGIRERIRVVLVTSLHDGLLVALPQFNWCLSSLALTDEAPTAESLVGEGLDDMTAILLAGILHQEWHALRRGREEQP